MEHKKLISSYEYTMYNCVIEVLLQLVYSYLIFLVYHKSKETFAKIISYAFKLRNLRMNFPFKLNYVVSYLIIITAISFYYLILINFSNLSSLYSLRTKLFILWKNLFRSDSNLTDFNSFQDYYCKVNTDDKNNLDQYNQYFRNTIYYLCGLSWFNIVYIEEIVINVIFIVNVIWITSKIDNSNNNNINDSFFFKLLEIISKAIDQSIKIFFYFEAIYFIVVYLALLNNYNNLKQISQASHIFLEQDDAKLHAYAKYSHKNKYTEYSSTKVNQSSQNEEEESFIWSILKELITIILDIID